MVTQSISAILLWIQRWHLWEGQNECMYFAHKTNDKQAFPRSRMSILIKKKTCLKPIKTESIFLLWQQSSPLSCCNKTWTRWPERQRERWKVQAGQIQPCSGSGAIFRALFYREGCGGVCACLRWYIAAKVDGLNARFLWNGCWGPLCLQSW